MKILLFSIDEYFLEVFSDLLTRKKTNLTLVCYTLESAAEKYLEKEKSVLLFCEEGYLTEYAGKMPYIVLGMDTVMPKENACGRLNIYQKASRILDDFERIVAFCTGETDYVRREGKQISAYSTEGGAGKTTIAYLTAVQYAKRKKTAYWNLEPLPATESLYRQEFKHSMEELLFSQKSGLQDILYETVLQNTDGVYVLPELRSFGDYKDIDATQIDEMCEKLYHLGIERIILDLPSGLPEFVRNILEGCDHIIWVFSDSLNGRRKEEKVKSDPYLHNLLSKSSIVRNRCRQKEDAAGVTAQFPNSETMQRAQFVPAVLEVNQEFVAGCQAIVAEAER